MKLIKLLEENGISVSDIGSLIGKPLEKADDLVGLSFGDAVKIKNAYFPGYTILSLFETEEIQ